MAIGNDILDGGAGVDILIGGTGDDIYIVDLTTTNTLQDTITETASGGVDTVRLRGGAVWPTFVTLTLGTEIDNMDASATGATLLNITGNALSNTLTGNAANNTLNGSTGADTMIGGIGNDTYIIDNLTDTVIENTNEGTDLMNVAVATAGGTYTLAANVENATLTNTVAYNLTGNTLNNVLTGNFASNRLTGDIGNDVLNGLGGSDTMLGGTGDDTYTIDVLTDVITENANEGTDLVNVAIASSGGTYTLAANIENATITSTVAYNLTGNDLNNTLTGNAAANTLNGGLGADTMVGGVGNDTYVVDNDADIVNETSTVATEVDLVQSSISYTLGANLEKLTLTGASAINGTGNTLNNTITGNTAANILDGGTGADTLIGGAGNDTYIVDLTSTNTLQDTISEAISGGIDTVKLRGGAALSTFSTLTLGTEIDNMDASATGATLLNLTGNAVNNTITGNSANNTLNGGTGIDILIGGAGNDTYVIDVLTDIIKENVSEGTDLVNVAIATSGGTYALAANLENATLTGTVAYNLSGNELNNVLTGNAANNILIGGAGSDTLNGLGGNDTLTGGLGNDSFRFTSALSTKNIDTISDFLSGADKIVLNSAIFTKLLNDTNLSDNLVVGGTDVKALDANDYLIFNNTTKALYYDADGSGRYSAPVQFATLTNVSTMSGSDFVVI